MYRETPLQTKKEIDTIKKIAKEISYSKHTVGDSWVFSAKWRLVKEVCTRTAC